MAIAHAVHRIYYGAFRAIPDQDGDDYDPPAETYDAQSTVPQDFKLGFLFSDDGLEDGARLRLRVTEIDIPVVHEGVVPYFIVNRDLPQHEADYLTEQAAEFLNELEVIFHHACREVFHSVGLGVGSVGNFDVAFVVTYC